MAGFQSQYQHFIPRFLLRNFAHKYNPHGTVDGPPKKKKGHKYEKNKFPGDPVVYSFTLQDDGPLEVRESPISRTFGEIDMYRDECKPTENQQVIEEKFRKMERQAGEIYQRIVNCYEKGESVVVDQYLENDKKLMKDYMAKKGFSQPMEVWFEGLDNIIELDMNKQVDEWREVLVSNMFFLDAIGFYTHVTCSFMAICTVADADAEYLLADNTYNIFEGPSNFVVDPGTGKVEGFAYRPFHEFAPISPKLMLVLRANDLPYRGEELSQQIRDSRKASFRASVRQWETEPRSLLQSLPVYKALNSNPCFIIPGKGPDKRWRPRAKDVFTFPVQALATRHVNTINGIILDNAFLCQHLVFGSEKGFFVFFDQYMASPGFGHGVVCGPDVDKQWALAKKLQNLYELRNPGKPFAVPVQIAEPEMENFESFQDASVAKHRYLTQIFQDKTRKFDLDEFRQHVPEVDEYLLSRKGGIGAKPTSQSSPNSPRPANQPGQIPELKFLDSIDSELGELIKMLSPMRNPRNRKT
ncbi:unnamed protein product [Parascedosporium putredinis]|uniref:DUF4238 domain-containing protein n=1 Tax=Parascedosporium putredinis TaxID=1442378 RepID=A0A9P1GVP0_9PEZI|nr:unnamed protein product [Parascedosporium putredinis]CAI7987920.1 unnamed protein product [Parascedosporium putredinis]